MQIIVICQWSADQLFAKAEAWGGLHFLLRVLPAISLKDINEFLRLFYESVIKAIIGSIVINPLTFQLSGIGSI